MSRVTSILLAGVGGQGVLLASEILAAAAARAGHEVKKSEVHGMAQRGGSVVSHLRFGAAVFSPLIPRGEADFLLSFELLETLRYLDYLHERSVVLVNRQAILPLPVSTGRLAYPGDVEERLRATGLRHRFIDGLELAAAAGSPRAVNAVVLGALATFLPFGEEIWAAALRAQIPERHRALNERAFALGRGLR